jgi:uncharacterized membrane protein
MKNAIWQNVRDNILIGSLLLLPLLLTIFIANWLFGLATNFMVVWLPKEVQDVQWKVFLLRIAFLVLLVVVMFCVGVLARNVAGKKLFDFGDKALARVPMLNKIYVWLRQISETFLDQSGGMFKEVVLVEYPRPGVFAVGFVTAAVPPQLAPQLAGCETAEAWVGVFLPVSPPTSGFFVLVRRFELRPLKVSVSEAMKLLISGGTVFPGAGEAGSSLLEKAEGWIGRRS